jgi:hypothetical protein
VRASEGQSQISQQGLGLPGRQGDKAAWLPPGLKAAKKNEAQMTHAPETVPNHITLTPLLMAASMPA